MKPRLVAKYPEKVRDALLDNRLGHLIEYLENVEYMKIALEEHMRKLDKTQTAIPVELDWVFAQYNYESRIPNQPEWQGNK